MVPGIVAAVLYAIYKNNFISICFSLNIYFGLIMLLFQIYMLRKISLNDGFQKMHGNGMSADFVAAYVAFRTITFMEAAFVHDRDGDTFYAICAFVNLILALDFVYYYILAVQRGTMMTFPL